MARSDEYYGKSLEHCGTRPGSSEPDNSSKVAMKTYLRR
jgi:hypothetical protein